MTKVSLIKKWNKLVSVPNSQQEAYDLMLKASKAHGDIWAAAAHMNNYYYRIVGEPSWRMLAK